MSYIKYILFRKAKQRLDKVACKLYPDDKDPRKDKSDAVDDVAKTNIDYGKAEEIEGQLAKVKGKHN